MISGSAGLLLITFYCDWFAMSSYVFQFFCGPEGIALANPGRARTRPALAGPPPRASAELVFEEPLRPAARCDLQVKIMSGPGAPHAAEGLVIVTGVIIAATADQDRHRAVGADTGAAGRGGKEANSVFSR